MNHLIGSIYILSPDLKQPSGGIKRLYRYGSYLKEEGYQAFIVHGEPGFSQEQIEPHTPPIIYGSQLSGFKANDVIFIPEVFGNVLPHLSKLAGIKIMVALNQDYIFENLPPKTTWGEWGITRAITTCKTIAEVIKRTMGIEATIIRPKLNRQLYFYDENLKRNQIAYLSRKDVDSSKVVKVLNSDPGRFNVNGWSFKAISNVAEAEYAQILRESRVYLTTSTQEGVPMPVLEALACGCEVIGYRGPTIEEQYEPLGLRTDGLFESGDYMRVANYFTQRAPPQDLAKQAQRVIQKHPPENERNDLLGYVESLKLG